MTSPVHALIFEEHEKEIARLRSDLTVEKINNKRLQSERNNAEVEIDRLQNVIKDQRVAQLDKLGGRFDAQLDKIARLEATIEDLLSFIDNEDSDCVEAASKAIDWLEAEVTRLQAVLEKIVQNGDQGIHVPAPYDIAKEALAREGK